MGVRRVVVMVVPVLMAMAVIMVMPMGMAVIMVMIMPMVVMPVVTLHLEAAEPGAEGVAERAIRHI